MGHRWVKGLEWAKLGERPKGLPQARLRGIKGTGIRYERAVAGELPDALHGQWFEFGDKNGPGWCQPDILLLGASKVLVLEVKYSWVPEGHTQIGELYRPVVEKALGRPVLGVVVCRRLKPGMKGVLVVATLAEAVEAAKLGKQVCLHWLGYTALRPLVRRTVGKGLDIHV